ncbi:MAG: hypothetical protein R6X02_32250 [Enhygromyxa sp.]
MTRRLPLLAALVSTLALGTGCDLLAQLSQTTGIVDVFASSHGTPDEEGNLPSRNGQQLIFSNDMGWQVFVNEAYVTTSAVTLQSCDGERFDVELYWGPLAEDIGETADREQAGLGGVRANSGSYCELLVEYAPTAEEVANPAAVGTTVYLSGSAVKDDQHVQFVWASEVEINAEVDISKLENGTPFRISEDQHFSKQVTVSKSYDRFFAGVDFAEELSQGDIDALVAASLKEGTIAKQGK